MYYKCDCHLGSNLHVDISKKLQSSSMTYQSVAIMHRSMHVQGAFQHLSDNKQCCNLEKCKFAQLSVDEYLRHILFKHGVAKGPKVLKIPLPKDVGTLRSFMGSVQFYRKFLAPNLLKIMEPLQKATRKGQQWKWGKEQEQEAYDKLKDLLCMDTVLPHCNPSLKLSIPMMRQRLELMLSFFSDIPMTVRDQLPMPQGH